MRIIWDSLPQKDVKIDLSKQLSQLNVKKFSTGIGGVNSMPAPQAAVDGIKALEPKLIRIFIQEFFEIYKGNGQYSWEKLDAFMDSIHAMGADIMASICVKPPVLFPVVDENVFMPNNVDEWQEVIRSLVRRYSVERKYVTHWGIANETNIGEDGGCPYKITSGADYYTYYTMTLKPILEVCPDIKVGGPSFAGTPENSVFFDDFLALCKKNDTKLDFLAYNVYFDNPQYHVNAAQCLESIIERYGKPVDYFITEFNASICQPAMVEERAYDAMRSASHMASIIAMYKHTKTAGTFQYHAYDTYVDPRQFAPFYERCRFMTHHWNDAPHRLGLFSLDGEVRPEYFVYKLLYAMGGNELQLDSEIDGIHSLASVDGKTVRIMLSNFKVEGSEDVVVNLCFDNLPADIYRFTVQKIDGKQRWDAGLNLKPNESRLLYAYPDFKAQVYLPEDTVALITLEVSQ